MIRTIIAAVFICSITTFAKPPQTRPATRPLASATTRPTTKPAGFPSAREMAAKLMGQHKKEQDLLTVAIDVHYGRQARHLDRLLDRTHLAEKPWTPLPDAPHPWDTEALAQTRFAFNKLVGHFKRYLGTRSQ